MLPPGELSIQIANTAFFIKCNPSFIALIPRTRHKDGSGMRWVNGEVRPVQEFRLIDQSTARNVIPGRVQTSDGVERLIDFILLATPEKIVQLWDFWEDADGTWEVAEMFPSNQYEIRAAVVRRA